MFYDNPRINNGDGIYNGGGGGGGGGGGANINNCFLLLSGIMESEPPIRGKISPTSDIDLPIPGILCYRNANADSDYGVAYGSTDFTSKLMDTATGWTMDCWFKPVQKIESFTPHFLAFTTDISNDTDWNLDLSMYYYSNLNSFLWDSFLYPSSMEFNITQNEWHHLAISEHNVTSTHDERFLFVDGHLIQHKVDWPKTTFNNMKLRFGGSRGRIEYKFAQICFRTGIVWESDFTPPTEPYRLY